METPKSKSTTEETYAGDGTFLHLTLGQAIRTALFEDDPEIIRAGLGS